jgi:hypothetical protein
VTQAHPERPLLATIISIYLVVSVLVPLPIALIYLDEFFHSVFIYHTTLPGSAMSWVIFGLAMAGAVTLWQIRFGLSLLLKFKLILAYSRRVSTMPPAITHSMIVNMAYAVIVADWILSALIVWYVYKITSPKASNPPLSEPETIA